VNLTESAASQRSAESEDRGPTGVRARVAAVGDLMGLTIVSLWPTALTFFAGLLATLGVWMLAETYPRSERTRTLLTVANGMRQVLEVRLNDHLRGLQLAADVWPRFSAADAADWKATAQMFLQQHSGFVVVALVPPAAVAAAVPGDGGEAPGAGGEPLPLFDESAAEARPNVLVARTQGVAGWLVGAELGERLRAARQSAMDEQRPSIDGPFTSQSGQSFYQLVLPLEAGAASEGAGRPQAGLLCAVLQPAPLLESLISELASGYFLAVHDDGALVYTQGTPPRPQPSAEGAEPADDETVELPIRLLMAKTWTLEMARPDLSELPPMFSLGRLVLTGGLIFSLLLAGVVYLGQVARVRARALVIANRELRSQIVSTAVAEGRVRRINESLEARVAERTRALDEVVTELETFNYSVSHDLRSPIGAIVNFTSILSEDYKDRLDEAGLDILRRVAGCAQNAVTMMDGLLTFSHIGQQALTPGTVETRPLVEAAVEEVLAAHPGPRPDVSIGALPSVTADPTMLRTVWTNLLSNAVKFSETTPEPSIEIGSQSSPDEDIFFVRDNGVGFDMKHAARLFNVFEQLHPTPRSKGHGVGLAIVSRIVRRHGGRVWAQAAPGKGATFYFAIPRQAA